MASVAFVGCLSLKPGGDRGDGAMDARDTATTDADVPAMDQPGDAPPDREDDVVDGAVPDADVVPSGDTADVPGELALDGGDGAAPDADVAMLDADVAMPDADVAMPDADVVTPDADVSTGDAPSDRTDASGDAAPDVVDVVTCPTGQTRCDAVCVDTATHVSHCGACGRSCPPGQSCTAGTCACSVAGQTYCAGIGCVVTATDVAHCGACGNRCGDGMVCASGMCRCPSGLTLCGTTCVDTTSSATHCGMCGRACDSAFPNALALCVAGTCAQVACRTGFGDCNLSPGCESNLATDANNCGACNNRCRYANATATCAAGVCAMGACNTGFADCNGNAADGCETNLQTESTDCGSCRNVCTAPTGRTAYCAAGTCMVGTTCATPTADCDGMSGNGCEVTLTTDAANCGACGNRCSFANAPASCASSACVMGACNTGFGNCDGDASTGCEADFASNPSHCGGCGRSCSFANASAVCTAGACAMGTCAAGFGNCDGSSANGCETSLTIGGNCGSCGRTCASGQACSSGVCCPTGQTACGGVCRDTRTDVNHCGACGAACASGLCEAGVCVRAIGLAMGFAHTCAAMSDGTARCWGSNSQWQLTSAADMGAQSIPITIRIGTRQVQQVAAGNGHTCARTELNTIFCWGSNTQGQIGTTLGGGLISVPWNVADALTVTNAAQVTAGSAHSCARLADDTVSCWGNYLALGANPPTACMMLDYGCPTPRTVVGLADVLGVASSADYTCARLRSGDVWCWGANVPPETSPRFAPGRMTGLSGVVDVSAGGGHACAVRSDGTVRCWGTNTYGSLGTGDTADRSSSDPGTVVGLSDATRVAAGGSHTCALRADGTVSCWGNLPGAALTATPVRGLTGVVELASGQRNACARLASGGLRCWGINGSGEVGDGTFTTRTEPVPVVWH